MLVTEPTWVAEEFKKYFKSVFTNQCAVQMSEERDHISSMSELVVTQEGLFSMLLRLDNKKSDGQDTIYAEFLRW